VDNASNSGGGQL